VQARATHEAAGGLLRDHSLEGGTSQGALVWRIGGNFLFDGNLMLNARYGATNQPSLS
jgi:hypothetical protein